MNTNIILDGFNAMLKQLIASAVADAVKPLQDKINMLETQVACSFDDEKKMVGDRLTALEINQTLVSSAKINFADLVAELVDKHDFVKSIDAAISNYDFSSIIDWDNKIEEGIENYDFSEIFGANMPDPLDKDVVDDMINEALNMEAQYRVVADDVLAEARDVLYLGRGTSFPIALEGALKLKEISYIHAEGYAAGEMKHGPIALIDEMVPVVVVAPNDSLFDKTASNFEQVKARGGKLVLLSDAAGVARLGPQSVATLTLPAVDPAVAPILYTIPVQLLAYYTAIAKGTDVDQPRNLAKSVTVE